MPVQSASLRWRLRAVGMSYFADDESDFGLANDLTANFAGAASFANLASEFCHFHFDKKDIAGTNWLAPFDVLG